MTSSGRSVRLARFRADNSLGRSSNNSTAGKNLDDLRMTISRLRWLDHVGKIITLWGNEVRDAHAREL